MDKFNITIAKEVHEDLRGTDRQDFEFKIKCLIKAIDNQDLFAYQMIMTWFKRNGYELIEDKTIN